MLDEHRLVNEVLIYLEAMAIMHTVCFPTSPDTLVYKWQSHIQMNRYDTYTEWKQKHPHSWESFTCSRAQVSLPYGDLG